jgi:tetratricopeptide (TPR) repeat protein
MQPRAFVVMPFGVKDGIDFDAVYERLLKPALVQAGCVPFRADQEPAAGDIRTDMFYELVTADVIVADISLLNPNVFYELGVRHGVAPRGVFMVHGGWSRRPFDVAPDRTFNYDGTLFAPERPTSDEAWRTQVAAEAERLGGVLRAAIDTDPQTIGSPVYKELAGLQPPDWTQIQSARAKYFGKVFADLEARIDVAKLNGHPGDILTLADDAPTRLHRLELLWHAADALCSMHRFHAAEMVLRDLLDAEANHRDGQIRMGLVLARLGKVNEAKIFMTRVAQQYEADTEASGILGRIYKDQWRLEWKDVADPRARQRAAVDASGYLLRSIRTYEKAARRRLDHYTGINVVSMATLLEHLSQATGEAVDHGIRDLDTLTAVVRFAAENVLAGGNEDEQDSAWAAATLGELELVTGTPDRARQYYRRAAGAPATTYFNVSSMLDQVYLFDNLAFRPDVVAAVKALLEQRLGVLETRLGGMKKSVPKFAKVFVASGHMIDSPGRPDERFPARKESAVRDELTRQLDRWRIAPGDLAICGAARGADILFAESAAERGAEVWLMLALPEAEFLDRSVRMPDTTWEQRYFDLRGRPGVTAFDQRARLDAPPRGASVFARNNLWIVNTARVEVTDPRNLHALLVWDERPRGDGPGGTADAAARVRQLGGRIAVVNPTRL